MITIKSITIFSRFIMSNVHLIALDRLGDLVVERSIGVWRSKV